MKNLTHALAKFRQEFTESEEMRIYTLLELPSRPLHETSIVDLYKACWVFVQPLPSYNDNREIFVHVKKYQREDPELKSLTWMKEKSEMEKTLPVGCEEGLLAGGETFDEIYEGLSSNFYVIQQGSLFVAPEGTILQGTVMKLVLEACVSLGIPIVRAVPSLRTLNEWSGCFISSTTRLALPIHRICFPDHNWPEKIYPNVCQEILAIRSFVKSKLESRSTPIEVPEYPSSS